MERRRSVAPGSGGEASEETQTDKTVVSSLFGKHPGTNFGTLAYIFQRCRVYEDEPKSDLPAGESCNIHTVMKVEGGLLKADARENDFALQMRSNFGQVTQMATCQFLNNSL